MSKATSTIKKRKLPRRLRNGDCGPVEQDDKPIKVAIFGGGVAGLSAAHELSKFGNFEVRVYEKEGTLGGKARSQDVREHFKVQSKDPLFFGEHGFRLFPHFYRHIIETLKEIPVSPRAERTRPLDGSVLGELRGCTEAGYADGTLHKVERPFPSAPGDFLRAMRELFGNDSPMTEADAVVYAWHVLKFLTACDERRDEEFDQMTWAEFVGVGKEYYTKSFEDLIVSVPRSLSAMRPNLCSARSCGATLVQMLFDFVGDAGLRMDALLTGPTDETWLGPWKAHLEDQGVVFDETKNHTLIGLELDDDGTLAAAVVENGKGERMTLQKGTDFDYAICAIPLEAMQKLLEQGTAEGVKEAGAALEKAKELAEEDPERKRAEAKAHIAEQTRRLLAFDASLRSILEIQKGTAPMVGIQFYLQEDVPICNGHVFYPDSPWALTSVSQAQFWKKGRRDGELGAGDRVKKLQGVLSVIISDWEEKGHNKLRADECTEVELKVEAWIQLTKGLATGEVVLRDEHLRIPPGVKIAPPPVGSDASRRKWLEKVLHDHGAAHLDENMLPFGTDGKVDKKNGIVSTPLFVHPRGSQALRPDAELRIPNLLLASDYVRTYTDLATMEAANEAARRAAIAILQRECIVSQEVLPKLFRPSEGTIFAAAKALDRILYRSGKQPHVMDAPALMKDLFGATFGSAMSLGMEMLGMRGGLRAPSEIARRSVGLAGLGARLFQGGGANQAALFNAFITNVVPMSAGIVERFNAMVTG